MPTRNTTKNYNNTMARIYMRSHTSAQNLPAFSISFLLSIYYLSLSNFSIHFNFWTFYSLNNEVFDTDAALTLHQREQSLGRPKIAQLRNAAYTKRRLFLFLLFTTQIGEFLDNFFPDDSEQYVCHLSERGISFQ